MFYHIYTIATDALACQRNFNGVAGPVEANFNCFIYIQWGVLVCCILWNVHIFCVFIAAKINWLIDGQQNESARFFTRVT